MEQLSNQNVLFLSRDNQAVQKDNGINEAKVNHELGDWFNIYIYIFFNLSPTFIPQTYILSISIHSSIGLSVCYKSTYSM